MGKQLDCKATHESVDLDVDCVASQATEPWSKQRAGKLLWNADSSCSKGDLSPPVTPLADNISQAELWTGQTGQKPRVCVTTPSSIVCSPFPVKAGTGSPLRPYFSNDSYSLSSLLIVCFFKSEHIFKPFTAPCIFCIKYANNSHSLQWKLLAFHSKPNHKYIFFSS